MEEGIQCGVVLWWVCTVRCKLIKCTSVLVFLHSLVYYFKVCILLIASSTVISTRFLCDEFAGIFFLKPLNLQNNSHSKSSDHLEDWLIVYGFIPYQFISQLIAGIQRNNFTVYIHSLVICYRTCISHQMMGKKECFFCKIIITAVDDLQGHQILTNNMAGT